MGIIKRQGLKSSIVNYVGVFIGALFFLIIFPNIISKEYLGFIQLVFSLTYILAQIPLFGMQNVLYKYYQNLKESSKLNSFNGLAFLILLIGFAIFLFFFLFFKDYIISFYQKESHLFIKYYLLLIPLVLIQAVAYYLEMYAMMKLRVAVPTFLREVLNRLFLIIIVLLLAYHFVSETQFIFLYFFIYLISVSILLYYAIRFFNFKISSPHFFLTNNKDKNEQIQYSLSSMLMMFVGTIFNFVDGIVLASFWGEGALGIYGRPLLLGQLIHIPYRSIALISSPIIMEAWKNNNIEKIKELNKSISVHLFLIGVFLFCLAVVNASNFFDLINNEEYRKGINVLYIIALSRLVDMSFGLNGEIIYGSKYYKWLVYFTVFITIVAFLLCLILIPVYGMNGAALSIFISYFLFNVLKNGFLYLKFQMNNFSIKYIYIMIIGIVSLFVPLYLPSFYNPILNIIFKSSLIVILYIPLIYYFNISTDFNDFIKLILSGKIFKGGHKMEEL